MGSYEQKMRDRFATFDRDGDGFVTETDFTAMAQQILAEFHISEPSDKGPRATNVTPA